jgi:hypothetical protein
MHVVFCESGRGVRQYSQSDYLRHNAEDEKQLQALSE